MKNCNKATKSNEDNSKDKNSWFNNRSFTGSAKTILEIRFFDESLNFPP